MKTTNEPPRARSPGATALAGLGYLALIAFLSWPLTTRLGSSLVDPVVLGGTASIWTKSDLDLLVWILAWGAHAVGAQPLAIFQGNIFHPAPDALASSEHLLGLLPVSGPVFWASGNAVLTYNVTTLIVVWTGAFTMYLLVRAWSGRAAAGFLAGALFALGGTVSLSFVRLHGAALHLYPLILLLAWRVAARPSPWIFLGLVVATTLQALAGIYVAFGLAALLAAATPSLVARARRHGHSGIAPLAAFAVGSAPLALVAGPYLRVRAAGLLPGPTEALAAVKQASDPATTLVDRLATDLTGAGLVLAIAGLMLARPERGVRACLGTIGAVGFVLALGTRTALPDTGLPSVYEALMATVPGFSGMRAPGRFLYLTQLAAVAFAGLGAGALVERAARRFGDTAGRIAIGAVVALAVASVPLRARHWPLPLSPDPLAGVYVGSHLWLALNADEGPVLDLPARTSVMDGRGLLSTGRAMLGSTLHWLPLLNGYSGHPPSSHRLVMTLAQRLPEPKALRDLCALTGVRWIVVHHGMMPGHEEAWQRAAAALPIRRVEQRGRDEIYEVTCDEQPVAVTPTPAAPLEPSARRARVELEAPTIREGGFTRFWADIENLGDAAWEGRRPRGTGTILVHSRWLDAETGALVQENPPALLAHDVPGGGAARVQIEALAPAPGGYVFEVEIRQEDGPPFSLSGGPRRRVRVEPAPS